MHIYNDYIKLKGQTVDIWMCQVCYLFFCCFLGHFLPAFVTALAEVPKVIDPEIPGAVDPVAFSNTMVTDAFLNVVIR